MDFYRLGSSAWQFVPVQTSKTLSGLLTGMNLVLKKKGVPFNLSFMTPVKNRLVSLDRGRCNFVITTKLAYEIGKRNLQKY